VCLPARGSSLTLLTPINIALQSKLKDVEASSISEAIAEATEELRIRRE
jgi:hypothetical protein